MNPIHGQSHQTLIIGRLGADTIAITNVNLSLGTGAARVHILKDISLRVAPGEAIGLIGTVRFGEVDLADGDGGAGAA
jgi:ABC-type polysaccharide/polyol phosphate transport system ATPase subunit